MNAQARWLLRQAEPRRADAVFEAAIAALKAGIEEEALPLVERSLKLHPNDARLWQALGLLHRACEDMGPAVRAFARAAALSPDDPLIAHSHARTRLEAGLPASTFFDIASRLAPQDGSVILGRAAALFQEGRAAEAIQGLDVQLRRHPAWIPGHQTICRLRYMESGGEDYTRSFEEAVRAAPREVALWREYAETVMHAGAYEQALAIIARGRAAAGEHPSFAAAETVAVAEQGDTEAADRLFAALGPIEHITMAVRYVRHLFRAGRPEQAVAVAEAHAPRDPDFFLCPYLAAGWRLLGDPRWEWLEGDPRFVGIYDLRDRLPSLDDLAARLRALHLATHQPLEQSVRGGTQTDGQLFARVEPEFRALRKAIKEAVEAHVDQLPPVDPAHPLLSRARRPVRFSGSWSVRLTSGGRHSNHVHPAGWLSSALYVALPDEGERGPAPSGWLSLGELTELGLDLPPIRLIEPKPGRLVLFPSTMWHGTRPFASGERLTVAFDVAQPGLEAL